MTPTRGVAVSSVTPQPVQINVTCPAHFSPDDRLWVQRIAADLWTRGYQAGAASVTPKRKRPVGFQAPSKETP